MFKLPEFDFSKAAFLGEETVQFHYGRHHKAYIDKLNTLTENLPPLDILEIIKTADGAIYNSAAQAWNHTFYWMGLTPTAHALDKSSALGKAIGRDFSDETALQTKFIEKASALFGSGWTWLVTDKTTSKLEIMNTSNAEVVDFEKYVPLLICDVWEHAYYIEYRNARATYLTNYWRAINWKTAQEMFEKPDLSKVGKRMA